jgi:diguanylate cyclase (GGDEF)-like protein
MFRIVGLLALAGAWAVIALAHGVGSSSFILDSVVLALLGTYAFAAAARTRRISVNAEKRLRLGLLVHNMELENMAMQDDLTQLFNRRYFFDRLERELTTATAFKRPLSIIVIDLDSMKAVNDSYGHRVGDELLRNFGHFLLDQTRGSDVPARTGGDEFAIILPDTPLSQANKLMTRLARRLAAFDIIDRNELTLKVEASLGCAGFPETASSVDELVQQADSAMYAAKHERKVSGRPVVGADVTPVPHVFRKVESEAS